MHLKKEEHSVEFQSIMKGVPFSLSFLTILSNLVISFVLFLGLIYIRYPENKNTLVELSSTGRIKNNFQEIEVVLQQEFPNILDGQNVIISIDNGLIKSTLQGKVHFVTKNRQYLKFNVWVKLNSINLFSEPVTGTLVFSDRSKTLFDKIISKK